MATLEDHGLLYRERPPAGEPAGVLVMHHGRGTDENDLMPLADILDPKRRLWVISPRAPLTPPGTSGFHWYVVGPTGPEPVTFHAACERLAGFHDALAAHTGVGLERTVLGGFSQGAILSYALGLGAGRPAPAGILAISGFVPEVDGWSADLASRRGLPVFIAHGRRDSVIGVQRARGARELLEGTAALSYHESEAAHHVDPRQLPLAADWLERTLAT